MEQQKLRRRRVRPSDNKCANCEHVIFDEEWGEFKCKLRKRRVYSANEPTTCKDFKKRNKK